MNRWEDGTGGYAACNRPYVIPAPKRAQLDQKRLGRSPAGGLGGAGLIAEASQHLGIAPPGGSAGRLEGNPLREQRAGERPAPGPHGRGDQGLGEEVAL